MQNRKELHDQSRWVHDFKKQNVCNMIDKIEIELVKPDCVVCEWNRNED